MRVTDRMIFEQSTADVARARERAAAASQEASSGVRVTHPGDDPGAAGLLVATRSSQDRFDAIQKTAAAASDELTSADSALEAVGNAITRAQELAVQLSTTTNNTGLPTGALEVQSIIQDVIGALNTKVGNRYIFGGNKDDAPPFDTSGNYLGDDGVRQVEIAPNVTQAASVRADQAIKGTAGGVDILSTLSDLAAAMTSGDLSGIQAALDPLGKGISQVADARSAAGNAMNTFDTAVSVSQIARDEDKKRASDLGDADIIDASTKLTMAQQALQASLSVTAQGFRFTLLDYLK